MWRATSHVGRSLLFPPRCVSCERSTGWALCPPCIEQSAAFPLPRCSRCDLPLEAEHVCTLPPVLRAARVVAPHAGPLRRAIHALKYEGRTDVARPLGIMLAARWRHTGVPVDGLLPVPLGAARHTQRGYNQAALLAEEMAHVLELPVLCDALRRVRETRPQVGLSRKERLENVRGAFRASSALAGRSWLLVDDVCTTGATLSACAQALLAAGATRVYAITLTRSAEETLHASLAHELRACHVYSRART